MIASLQYYFLGFVLIALVAEIIWAKFNNKKVFNLKESLGNFWISIGNNIMKPISLIWKYLVFDWIAQFQFYSVPTTIIKVILTFIVAKFGFYWYYRISHETPLLWTLHHTHNSGKKMNLTTAVRLNWIGAFLSPIIYCPFVLLGFSPDVLIICITVGLFFQYFLHTEVIGKLGIFKGKIFNTPSAHRVHHGSNEVYIDKNYGGSLIIFDRIFGTYQPETEKVNYDVTTGFFSNNPFKLNFLPIYLYIKGTWKREKHQIKKNEPLQ